MQGCVLYCTVLYCYVMQGCVQDADMIEQLNETGELRQLLRPFQVQPVYLAQSLLTCHDLPGPGGGEQDLQ